MKSVFQNWFSLNNLLKELLLINRTKTWDVTWTSPQRLKTWLGLRFKDLRLDLDLTSKTWDLTWTWTSETCEHVCYWIFLLSPLLRTIRWHFREWRQQHVLPFDQTSLSLSTTSSSSFLSVGRRRRDRQKPQKESDYHGPDVERRPTNRGPWTRSRMMTRKWLYSTFLVRYFTPLTFRFLIRDFHLLLFLRKITLILRWTCLNSLETSD